MEPVHNPEAISKEVCFFELCFTEWRKESFSPDAELGGGGGGREEGGGWAEKEKLFHNFGNEASFMRGGGWKSASFSLFSVELLSSLLMVRER